MGYYTQKFEEEKFVLSIFYGAITSEDLFNHVYAMNKKHDLNKDYRVVTDMTNVVENKSINMKTIMLMLKIRKLIRNPVDAKGVIVIDNARAKVMAEQFLKRANFKEGNMLILPSLDGALRHLGRADLKTMLIKKIDEFKIQV